MYMDDNKQFAKNENILETITNNEHIQSGYRNGIWHGKYAMLISEKSQMMEGIELPNQERIRTFREKSLWILEADTIK